ncbi:EI24 domain-containing protein [Kordiimonas lipolytica]|uniref:EI24 domain-containing protein n=1 Tax=Kordiimonas lipolytica TaxID=1662421 RepID=A0ABV8U7W8_9PROT|nr:EI24 domain-containing protein [Kordiimonas lipolytica]
MIGQAINRSWQQLLHPKFRSVFLISLIAATLTLIGLNYALYIYWPEDWTTGIDWLDQSGFWTMSIIGSYILFPGLVTMVMGFLVDTIADAVEEEYYPNRKGMRKVSLADVIFGALKLTLLVILVNIIAFVPYVVLLFTGIGTLLLFVAVNGFLLGREYFEMVAIRHMPMREVNRMRRLYGGKIFVGGAMIAALFAVPFLNLLAPILGAAMMTHIFHFLAHEDGRVFDR